MTELTRQDKMLVIMVDRLLHCPMPLRQRIDEFETMLKTYPQAKGELEHEFIDGLYRRQLTFPKGMVATGAVHTVDHMDVMLTGEMLVATPEGFKHLVAPCVLTSRAGQRKAGIAIKETIWISYHPTSATTVEDVMAEIIADDYQDIDSTCEEISSPQQDYANLIAELGMTEEQVLAELDLNFEPTEEEHVELKDSTIQGKGLFPKRALPAGTKLRAGNSLVKYTVGRYTNHSNRPNTVLIIEEGLHMLVTIKDLSSTEELTLDYRTAPRCKEAV